MSAFARVGVRFDNVTLGYDCHPAVHHVDGLLPAGSLTAVVGPNGSGKSTLLKGIAGELRPQEGKITTCGPAAYLPQQADIDRNFPIRVYDFVAMGLWQWIGAWGGISGRARNRIVEALARVGLSGFEKRVIGSLSGGQMQRLLFARLLLQEAPLILLDEPFNAIDQKTAADLLGLLIAWHNEGRTVIAVLHDIEQARKYFPETLLLARELIGRGRTADVLTAANLFKARQLCEAFDDNAVVCSRSART